jgi:farnesyl-diphosphate farnesyltransferase
MESAVSDEAYQDHILPHVSRTFALTIPQLPPALRTPVTTAYLLCRIADTIEDEPALSADETFGFLQRFAAVVSGTGQAAPLAEELAGRLSGRTSPPEHDLVRHMERIVTVTASLDEPQRAAIQRCVEVMCNGMHHFQHTASVRGLARSSDMDSYCYYVAGVVGEMLTELFCGYSPAIMRQQAALRDLAPSFAQGLQMTNILKDFWEDRSRGACWLPQEVFIRHGVDLARLSPEHYDARFHAGVRELIGVAHTHLRNALAYTLLIPGKEAGIRRFCLWAVGLALLTLRKIQRNPRFIAGEQVKVSRQAVLATRILTSVAIRNDWMLERLFEQAARGLPLAAPSTVRRRYQVATTASHASEPTLEHGHRPLRDHLENAERRSGRISGK